jgi:hypothetical protein
MLVLLYPAVKSRGQSMELALVAHLNGFAFDDQIEALPEVVCSRS